MEQMLNAQNKNRVGTVDTPSMRCTCNGRSREEGRTRSLRVSANDGHKPTYQDQIVIREDSDLDAVDVVRDRSEIA